MRAALGLSCAGGDKLQEKVHVYIPGLVDRVLKKVIDEPLQVIELPCIVSSSVLT